MGTTFFFLDIWISTAADEFHVSLLPLPTLVFCSWCVLYYFVSRSLLERFCRFWFQVVTRLHLALFNTRFHRAYPLLFSYSTCPELTEDSAED